MDDSPLERLEKEIYRNKPQVGSREREAHLRPHEDGKPPLYWSPEPRQHQPERKKLSWRVAFLWFAIGVSLLILGVYAVFIYAPTSFRTEDLQMSISGPRNISSGDLINYIVSLKNTSRIPVEDLVLTFEYPKGSIGPDGQERTQVRIPILTAGGENIQQFEVRVVGQENEIKVSQAKLSFKPQGTTSKLEAQVSFSNTVVDFPIRVDTSIPQQINPDEPLEVVVNYVSEAKTAWSDVALEIEYPQGFSVFSTDPTPEEGSRWKIGQLLPGSGSAIKIRGVISQQNLPDLRFRIRVGVFNKDKGGWEVWTESVASSVLVSPPVEFRILVDGKYVPEQIVDPGSRVAIDLQFKNNLKEPIKNMRLKARLDGRGYRDDGIEVSGGSYNCTSRTLEWNSATSRDLELVPVDSERRVNAFISLQDPPVMRTTLDSNFSFTVTAELEGDRTQGGEGLKANAKITFKVNSRLNLLSRAYWKGGGFAPRGPFPLQAGKTTYFTLSWQLANYANDIDDVVVSSHLPPNVKWTGLVSPDGAKVKYFQETGEVRWEVGRLKAGAGSIRPAQSIAFQVSTTPSANDIGGVLTIFTH